MNRAIRGLALGALALAGTGMALPAAAQDASTVLARVGAMEITLGHVLGVAGRLPEQYRQLPDEMLFQGILDQLVDQTALMQMVEPPFSTRVQIDIDNARREVIVTDALMRAVQGVLTEQSLRAFYEERYLGAAPALEYNAAHILVQTEEEAAALVAQLEGGADFAALARENSGDPGSAAQGGDLGWFGEGRMVPQFQAAVMALSPGETSAPVQTQFGWHVIRLLDTRSASAPPFEAVRDQLAAELQQKVVMEQIADAKAGLEIEVMSEGIDPALIRNQTLLDD